jgi:hypothetical protein
MPVPRTSTHAPAASAMTREAFDGLRIPAWEFAQVDAVACIRSGGFGSPPDGGTEAPRTRAIRSTEISLRGGPNGASAAASFATFM